MVCEVVATLRVEVIKCESCFLSLAAAFSYPDSPRIVQNNGRAHSAPHSTRTMGINNHEEYVEPPPFPFTVDKLVAEIRSDRAATAAQACMAFATLASQSQVQVMVPKSFRAAVPAVVALLPRRDGGFGAAAVKEIATAALSALLACVEGAAEDAVAEGVLGKLLNAASTLGEEESSRGTLDLNALDCFRILATNEAGAASLIADDEVMAFVTARCGGAGGGQVQAVSESALDVLCVLASKKTDGGASRAAVVRAGGVTALAKALVSAQSDEVTLRALLGLAMTTAGEAAQAELVSVPGAVQAVVLAGRSGDQAVSGISKDLWGVLGRSPGLKPAVAGALRTHMEEQQRLGAVDGMDAA